MARIKQESPVRKFAAGGAPRVAGGAPRARIAPGGGRLALLLALPVLLLLLLALPAHPREHSLPQTTPEQTTALQILRETVAAVEENYALLPDLKKIYAAGLKAMVRAIKGRKVKLSRPTLRRATLTAGQERIEVRFGRGGRLDLAAFERAYRFALSGAGAGEKSRDLKVMFAALEAMVTSLDRFSGFLTPDAFRELQVSTSGRYGGLGIRITFRDGRLTIIAPIENTPAFRAGLQAGDQIVAVEGDDTSGFSLLDAVKRLRGPPGSTVRISVLREGWTSPREFVIVRAVIRNRSVRSRVLEGGIGLLRISTFHDGTTSELDRELSRLMEAKVSGIILDLRNNPGGLLRQSVRVAERFLPEGNMIVFTRGRHRDQALQFQSRTDGRWSRRPLVVLTNKGSASASEIVAGALQDLKRAILVGQTTFGKGSVQTIIPLSYGAGIRLTAAHYYTPLGRGIHGKGIAPDVEAKNPAPQNPPAAPKAPRDARPAAPDLPLEIAQHVLREVGGGGFEKMRAAAVRYRNLRRKRISQARPPVKKPVGGKQAAPAAPDRP